jgi:hypothetical protein
MFASGPHVDGAIIVETHALLRCFSAQWAVWNVRQISANPAAALQIGGRNYAPSAASFVAVFMQRIGAFSAKSKIGLFARKGADFRRARLRKPALRWPDFRNYRCLHTV